MSKSVEGLAYIKSVIPVAGQALFTVFFVGLRHFPGLMLSPLVNSHKENSENRYPSDCMKAGPKALPEPYYEALNKRTIQPGHLL